MLKIDVKEHEFYDNNKELFFYTAPCTVKLEHSLISVSKWEAYWKKPYLPSRFGVGISGREEELYYISCMVMGNEPPDYIPGLLLDYHGTEIQAYIADPHSATTIHRMDSQQTPSQTITTELIYYWMIKYNVPAAYEKWHLNRLLMLLDVCSVKEQAESGRMSPVESAKYRQKINKRRRGQ